MSDTESPPSSPRNRKSTPEERTRNDYIFRYQCLHAKYDIDIPLDIYTMDIDKLISRYNDDLSLVKQKEKEKETRIYDQIVNWVSTTPIAPGVPEDEVRKIEEMKALVVNSTPEKISMFSQKYLEQLRNGSTPECYELAHKLL